MREEYGSLLPVSTHSRPKAAGRLTVDLPTVEYVSTHSRPKAAGKLLRYQGALQEVSTHSRPKAAGSSTHAPFPVVWSFQHTAARRRLAGGIV